jgi:hypothetical protein
VATFRSMRSVTTAHASKEWRIDMSRDTDAAE